MDELKETEKFLRARQIEPEEMIQDTFKTIRLASGVKAIVGLKEEGGQPLVQSVLFDKTRFSNGQAQLWMKKNKVKFMEAIALEYKKDELFADDFNSHLQGHLPPLTPFQLSKLMEIIGEDEDEEGEESEEDYLEERDPKYSNFENKYIHIE